MNGTVGVLVWFGDHICSGLTPVSVLRDDSWCGSGDHMVRQGSNQHRPPAKQVPYLLHYLSAPPQEFLISEETTPGQTAKLPRSLS